MPWYTGAFIMCTETRMNMKFVHLSDLHIGKRVYGFSLLEEQRYLLQEIANILEEKKVEGVWIAGDIYDTAVPSAEAVTLFDEFLTEISRLNIPVFIISGNHDSAERLAFGNQVFQRQNIFISSVYGGKTKPVILQDAYGEIAVYGLPYIRPAQIRSIHEQPEIHNHNEAVRYAIEQMEINPKRRNVILSHQFVTGAVSCDSEEVYVGGIDNVDGNVYDQFDYVALGHIHSPQRITRDTMRYSGSPLKYSFSEVNQEKKLLLVDLQEKGQIIFQEIPLKARKEWKEIEGYFEEIISPEFYEKTDREAYVRILLKDENEVPSAAGILREIYPGLMRIDYVNQRKFTENLVQEREEIKELSPEEILEDFMEKITDNPLTQEQRAYINPIIEEIWRGGKEK